MRSRFIFSGATGVNTGADPAPNFTSKVYNPNLIEIDGQSNAAGSAPIAGFPLSEQGVQSSMIFNTITRKWEAMNGGVNNRGGTGLNGDGAADVQTGAGGPELKLMQLLTTLRGAKQYLIKYGISGTYLQSVAGKVDWSNASTSNGRHNDKANAMFKDCIAGLGDKRPPRYYIWIQGENDTGNTTYSTSYQANLESFIAAKRTFYGWASMPFVIVRLGNNQTALNATNLATIRTAQTTVAAEANNYLVDADGLATQVDNTHYTADSYDTLAQRIYNVITAIID